MPDNNENNGWNEYCKYILAEIKRLDENDTEQYDALKKLDIDMAVMRVKSGVFGFIGASIPILIAIIIYLIQKVI